MLKHLVVRNFILIDEVDLDFAEGFSAFTGETGAGKSILIDAIGMLCGQRASAGLVKSGASQALIEGIFDFSHNLRVREVLQDAGLEPEELENVVISRQISAEGKSTMRLNYRVTTVNLVKEILSYAIDIHSQHDTQYLLNRNSFLRLLDQYAADSALNQLVGQRYQIWRQWKEELEEAKSPKTQQDLEFLQFQLDEITQAQLKPKEDEQLEQLEKRIASREKLFQRVSEALQRLDGEQGLLDSLYETARLTGGFADQNELNEISEAISGHYYALQDLTERLRDFCGSLEFSEEQINQVQSRLFEINRLKRKYGRSVEEILDRQQQLTEQLDRAEHLQEHLALLEKRTQEAWQQFEESAGQLSALRHQKALHLQKEIEGHLHDLMLPHARFVVELTPASRPSSSGLDDVDFLISMNPGEPVRPLVQTASGGELSRLMLGLKTIFTRLAGIETVIFDEIDTGVSGQVATAIGVKMSLLSQDAQVFAVTHLAQVAACADRHYHVTKTQSDQSTQTQIHSLNQQERIAQLALISQGEQSAAALQAAAELLERNRSRAKEARRHR